MSNFVRAGYSDCIGVYRNMSTEDARHYLLCFDMLELHLCIKITQSHYPRVI